MRIGHGYDVHAFAKDRDLILGGVKIDYEMGLAGHSDADVVIHAVCDALLGAAALGDIGHYFPDDDEKYQNIDSRILLREVAAILREKHYSLANLDITIIAQAPKMAPHINAMRETFAEDLHVKMNQVNIKATTTEHLGYIGRKEGIAVHAVALIE